MLSQTLSTCFIFSLLIILCLLGTKMVKEFEFSVADWNLSLVHAEIYGMSIENVL